MKNRRNPPLPFICTIFLLILGLSLPMKGIAQNQGNPFNGHFYNQEEGIHLYLNLDEPTLTAPGMDFLGKVNGYLEGDIYGVWLLTKFKAKGNTVTLRFSNDLGADAQGVKLEMLNDSTLKYSTIGGNYIKKIHKRKLVKISEDLTFKRIK